MRTAPHAPSLYDQVICPPEAALLLSPGTLCCTQATSTFITTAVIFPFTATCCHPIGCHEGSLEWSRRLAISKLIWGFL